MSVKAPFKFLTPTTAAISSLAGGDLVALFIGIVGSVIQARYVTPDDLGFFRSFSIFTGCVYFLHLGSIDGLQRLYPYYMGKNHKIRALHIVQTAQTWAVLVTTIFVVLCMLLSCRALILGDWRTSLGWAVQSVILTGFIYGAYLAATYRTGHDFFSVAKGSVISSLVGLATLPLFPFFSYLGLALRTSAGPLVNLIYLHLHRPLRLNFKISIPRLRALIRIGFPMFIASYGAGALWSVVEVTVVLKTLGVRELGYWTISFMIFEMANKIPQAACAVYNPRVMATYGNTHSETKCLNLILKPMLFGVPLTLVMAAMGYFLLPYLVPVLMPHYVEALPVMCLALLGLPLIILDMPYSILVASARVKTQISLVYLGLLSFLFVAAISNSYNLGLMGIILASFSGRLVKILGTYWVLYRYSINRKLMY